MAPSAKESKRRARLRLVVQGFILLVLLGGIGTVGFIEYSAQPSFCTNCHNMQPYYDSWATSTHNDVPCIRCHYAPGIKAEAMGKVQAANQVVKYVTGRYGTRPWAEIEDAACLRSGCHSTRKLEGELTFLGVRFDHRQHLTDLRRGKRLRCTSCHSQIRAITWRSRRAPASCATSADSRRASRWPAAPVVTRSRRESRPSGG